MSNAVALRPEQPTPVSFTDIERMGDRIAKSGLFGMKTQDQAVALLLLSHAEGKHPAIAARDYDIIQGRPAKKAEAMQRDFLLSGGKIKWHELTDTKADATFSHPDGGEIRLDWTMDRAKKAGIGGKDNWNKFPRAMLRARCLSEGIRTVYPVATAGLISSEEAGDESDRPMTDVTPAGAQSKLDKLAASAVVDSGPTGGHVQDAPNTNAPKPVTASALYDFDAVDTTGEILQLTGADWLVQAEIALNSHADPAGFWKANEPTFYQIQQSATEKKAAKAIASCGKLADLAHSMLS